jgi:hypothetical protein
MFRENMCIQGDSRGKVNIVGCDNIGHTEKKVYIYMCLIVNGYWDRAVWIDKCKIFVNGNKEIVYC